MSNERIVRYTASELQALRAAAGPHDWTRFDSITEEELERMVAEDPDERGFETGGTMAGDPMAGVEPELVAMLPPAGPARDAEVSRIVRNHLKRRLARARRAG